ncbi:hypothetical protein [Hydrogenophaga sp.]|uniref:hypothetical protein n=1 Tax=Hydrogenophaga sp. TaxID=1904254 RepID=UPI00272D6CF2|nr:hypothetical protein [Hydrogenophaga sp.]
MNMVGPQWEPAVLVGIQKTAKRPETNKGGREEEEKRLGISGRSQGPDRLRSAKRNSVAGCSIGLSGERKTRPKKFRTGVRGLFFLSGEGACMAIKGVKKD